MTETNNPLERNIENINTVRLPNFWSSKPELWFKQVESQFFINKINSDKSKYHLVISSLPIDIFSIAIDVINNPPEIDLYSNLKKTIISRLTLSEESRLEKLISNSSLGDKKPSIFYRDLLQIAGENIFDDNLIIKLWRRRLPPVIDIAISASGKDQISDLLLLSDKIWETQQNNHFTESRTINSISQSNLETSGLTSLIEKMTDLTQSCQNMLKISNDNFSTIIDKIDSIQHRGHFSRNHHFSNSDNKYRQRSRSRSNNNMQYCFYHRRFKKDAFKCSGPPCPMFKEFKDKNISKNE